MLRNPCPYQALCPQPVLSSLISTLWRAFVCLCHCEVSSLIGRNVVDCEICDVNGSIAGESQCRVIRRHCGDCVWVGLQVIGQINHPLGGICDNSSRIVEIARINYGDCDATQLVILQHVSVWCEKRRLSFVPWPSTCSRRVPM